MNEDGQFVKLKEFIVHNEDLELLEARLNEFNPLNILDIERYEIRHSNVLAWLLNPNGNHGLGEKFLKKVISGILLENEEIDVPFSIAQLQSFNFYDTQVFREHKNIDILVVSRSNKFILLMENKVLSKGDYSQLLKYRERIQAEFPNYTVLSVLLELSGSEIDSAESSWCAGFSYERIYQVLRFIVELYKENLNAKVIDFILFYLKTLEVLTMQEKSEIVNLCKEIYQNHKDAINMIIEYGVSVANDEAIDKFKGGKDIVEIYRGVSMFWFLPKEYQKILPKIVEGWQSQYPVCFWFRFSSKRSKVGIILEVGPFDPVKRVRFLKQVKKSKLFRVPAKALEMESRYTRVFSKYMKYEDWDDIEQLVDKMEDLYKKSQEASIDMLSLIKKFNW